TAITKIQDNVFFFQESILAILQPQSGSIPPALISTTATRFAPASLDGTTNNPRHATWGSAGVGLMRFAPAAYADSLSSPAGARRPSARLVSNTVSEQTADTLNARNLSDWIYGWGQFIDHDLDLTTSGNTAFDILVPTGDLYFDPNSSGTALIYLSRSIYDAATGTAVPNVQQQVYTIIYRPTHFRH